MSWKTQSDSPTCLEIADAAELALRGCCRISRREEILLGKPLSRPACASGTNADRFLGQDTKFRWLGVLKKLRRDDGHRLQTSSLHPLKALLPGETQTNLSVLRYLSRQSR